jgi:glycosyltransferase involved in cell wall biosynthesis
LPENAPGAHRLSSLAITLTKLGHEVEVLTSFPNYPNLELYKGYSLKWCSIEHISGIKVCRCYTYIKKSKSLMNRALGFLSFQVSSTIVGITKIPKPDLIICLSPPIFLGITGLFLKWYYKAALVLNIADLWPESGIKLGVIKNKTIIYFLEKLELLLYQQSHGVAGQTQGIIDHVENKIPNIPTIWFKNGVDFKTLYTSSGMPQVIEKKNDDTFIIGYTGLVGYAQGLEVLIEAAKKLAYNPKIKFLIVGDGPKLEEIKQLTAEYRLDNVSFAGNVPKHEMYKYLERMSLTVVPLKKNDLFLGAIPSKIFDSLAHKVPVILGVDGEAKALFYDRYECAYFYEPENVNALVAVIEHCLENRQDLKALGEKGHAVINEFFNRDKINVEITYFIERIYIDRIEKSLQPS